MQAPLAERMRPRRLSDMVGQPHLTGAEGALSRMLASGKVRSMLFWGPPGVGKTTLAMLLAQEAGKPFIALSAVNAGVKEVRAALEQAAFSPGTLLFIDEIHRFNKNQQDALLMAVEQGLVTLIGATTENPSFELNPALRSRCQLYVLNPLSDEDVLALLNRAIHEDEVLSQRSFDIQETEALLTLAGGDGRKALNLLELMCDLCPPDQTVSITNQGLWKAAQQKTVQYDKNGEQHYDIISAFIKSIRGSDPNAGLYWLARMIEGGEDVRFIARRLVILASEDVGNANPNALLLATACFQACDMVGWPESRIILAQTVTYLATSAKSNAAYAGIDAALAQVRQEPARPVPLHLRNAPTGMMKKLGYGQGYKYSHSFQGTDANQQFLPDGLEGKLFYQPKNVGKEREILDFLKKQWPNLYS